MLISWNRGNKGHFKFSFDRGQNYSFLIGRAAKILAPDWLMTPVFFSPLPHLVAFIILCPKATSYFRFFGVRKSSHAAARKNIPEGEFSCVTRNSKILFVSKVKSLDQICLVEKLKSVMATRCFHLATSSCKER